MKATCGFCGLSGVTKEHVWPDWMRKLILKERGWQGKRFAVEVERSGKTSRFPSISLESTVKMPCARCNSGWMSDLENETKPFMSAMVFPGDKTILTDERRFSLAKWAVKTGMVFEYLNGARELYFTSDERLSFKETR